MKHMDMRRIAFYVPQAFQRLRYTLDRRHRVTEDGKSWSLALLPRTLTPAEQGPHHLDELRATALGSGTVGLHPCVCDVLMYSSRRLHLH
jgi:hypothetical protein